MRPRVCRGFSLTELLVVIGILMILASILIVTTGEMVGRAVQLKCQHRLEQLGAACQMFTNAHDGRYLRSYDTTTHLRWYDSLLDGKYIDNRDVARCPQSDAVVGGTGSGASGGEGGGQESDLPILLYNTGAGRSSTNQWAQWDPYLELRAWLEENLEYGLIYTHADNSLVPLSDTFLGAASQAWFLNCELHTYKPGQNVFEPSELAAIKKFHDRGAGIHCLTESYMGDDYYRSANNIFEACGNVGLRAGNIAWPNMIWWDFGPSGHPVMQDSSGPITKMRSAGSPAKLWIENDPKGSIVGTCTVTDSGGTVLATDVPMITAWDDGNARILVHASYTSFTNSGYDVWPYGDVRRYCLTSEKWLRSSGGLRSEGRCSYGYNNLVGVDARTVSADTIVIMDYQDWEIDHDGKKTDDDDSYIALRHGGRANALLGDHRVRALRIGDIGAGMWTPEPGD